MLLNLIRSHAVSTQATRTRDDAGRIVATLDDYELVRGSSTISLPRGQSHCVGDHAEDGTAVSELLGKG